MKTSFAKRAALIVLPLVITVAGAWLLMRSLGTGSALDQAQTGGRKVLYYKSTMMLGESARRHARTVWAWTWCRSMKARKTARPSRGRLKEVWADSGELLFAVALR
jgi:hypothetical protein